MKRKTRKTGAGRPLKEAGRRRENYIFLRVDSERKSCYKLVAERLGVSMADWILDACDRSALAIRRGSG